MASHTAKSLFDLNMKGAGQCLVLHDGIVGLNSTLDVSWLLRGVVVFSISALDAYFHDKIRYRAGKYGKLESLPTAMSRFQIPLGDLRRWQSATRKGNVLRNWIVEHYSRRALQAKDDIADALKVVGIVDLWSTVEPDTPTRDQLLKALAEFVQRRNAIVHEGDRLHARRSGKQLRPIERDYVNRCMLFVYDLVSRIEDAFPS